MIITYSQKLSVQQNTLFLILRNPMTNVLFILKFLFSFRKVFREHVCRTSLSLAKNDTFVP